MSQTIVVKDNFDYRLKIYDDSVCDVIVFTLLINEKKIYSIAIGKPTLQKYIHENDFLDIEEDKFFFKFSHDEYGMYITFIHKDDKEGKYNNMRYVICENDSNGKYWKFRRKINTVELLEDD